MVRDSIGRAYRISKKYLSPSRFSHSLRTMKMALRLEKRWGGDRKLLVKASLLHDLGYSFGGDALGHAKLGARHAALLGFDKGTARAIEIHTLGKEEMSLEEKILFLADGIEEARVYPGLSRIRRLAFIDLDRALLAYIESTRRFLKKTEKSLHRDTYKLENNIRRKYGRTCRKDSRLPRRKASFRYPKL